MTDPQDHSGPNEEEENEEDNLNLNCSNTDSEYLLCDICGENPCPLVEYKEFMDRILIDHFSSGAVLFVDRHGNVTMFDDSSNKQKRYYFYKYLAKERWPYIKHREPHGACIDGYVRELFPSESDEYTGFKEK